MRHHRRENDYYLSERFVDEATQRIARQKARVAELKRKGRAFQEAEIVLRKFERALLEMKNHRSLMQDLMSTGKIGRSEPPAS